MFSNQTFTGNRVVLNVKTVQIRCSISQPGLQGYVAWLATTGQGRLSQPVPPFGTPDLPTRNWLHYSEYINVCFFVVFALRCLCNGSGYCYYFSGRLLYEFFRHGSHRLRQS